MIVGSQMIVTLVGEDHDLQYPYLMRGMPSSHYREDMQQSNPSVIKYIFSMINKAKTENWVLIQSEEMQEEEEEDYVASMTWESVSTGSLLHVTKSVEITIIALDTKKDFDAIAVAVFHGHPVVICCDFVLHDSRRAEIYLGTPPEYSKMRSVSNVLRSLAFEVNEFTTKEYHCKLRRSHNK